MKHLKLILTLVVLLLGSSLFAQSPNFGLLGGLNFSNVVGRDAGANNRARTGIFIGGFAEIQVKERWAFRPEMLLFSQKGTKNGNTKFSTSYLEVPLLAVWQQGRRLNIHLGPQLSVLYKAHVNDGRDDITESIRKLDVGLVLGAHVALTEQWGLLARLVPGITKVGESGEENTFNLVFHLGADYQF